MGELKRMKYFLSFICVFLLIVKNSYGRSYTDNNVFLREQENSVENVIQNSNNDSGGNRIMSVEENDIVFRYYNKNMKDTGVRIFVENATERITTEWRKNRMLKVITHGWLSSGLSPSVFGIKNAYLSKMDVNIITVDWSDPASWKLYPVPAYLTWQVGKLAANLIDNLVQEQFVALDKVHIIGHSLGAHVAGASGAQLKSGRISRITGLDPAGPAFEYHHLVGNVLDKSDAEFVDVIHTAGGVAGYYGRLGHADFYPNGGTPPQPGCIETESVTEILKFVGCSHGRAYEYFTDSILHSHTYKAFKCESWTELKNGHCSSSSTSAVYMGDEVPANISGMYYLRTKSEAPYGIDDG